MMIQIIDPRLNSYAVERSKPEPEYLTNVRLYTEQNVASAQMLSGPLEGNFLKMVTILTGASRILELGTYTGYSALWMAQGLRPGGKIITCEFSEKHMEIARRHFDASPFADQIEIKFGPALNTLETLEGPFDLVFIDADKENYPKYYEKTLELLRPGGSILIDNTLWSGKVLDPQDTSTKAIDNLNQIMASDPRVDSVLLTLRDGIHWARKR